MPGTPARPVCSGAGWILRPETGPQSYRVHAVALYQALYAMTAKQRRVFADDNGGVMAPTSGTADETADVLQAVAGLKPAGLVLGGDQTRRQAAAAITGTITGRDEEHPSPERWLSLHAGAHGVLVEDDPQMQYLLVSRSPEAFKMISQGMEHEPRNAWRHVLVGVALGYSDADIARFLSRDTPAMNFELGNQPRTGRSRADRSRALERYEEHLSAAA